MTIGSMADERPQWWGMAGVFPGELGLWRGDEWLNRLHFVADRGFDGGAVLVETLNEPGRLDALKQLAQEYGQSYSVHYPLDYSSPLDESSKRLEDLAKKHILSDRDVSLPTAVFLGVGVTIDSGGGVLWRHIDYLRELLTPAVEQLRAAGITPAIENHGDYYVSDLVELCGLVPGLTILLDTGNCSLVGERLDLIPDEAFPRISSVHFKDHWLAPKPQELKFELKGRA